MKISIALLSLLVVTLARAASAAPVATTQFLTGAQALAGGVVGNGGGGIAQDGRYMTFYTAGLYTEPQERTDQNIPNLSALVSTIDNMQYLSDFTKAELEAAILPSPSHTYFAVDAKKFDATTQARLIAEFARVTHVDDQKLALFAVTDTNAKQTFLLPSFFQLSANDQMTILFHESYWLMHPNATYGEVVGAEMAFEAVLSQPSDAARIMDFLNDVGSPSDQFLYALQSDKATSALKGLVNTKNEVSVGALFGNDYLECIRTGDHPGNIYGGKMVPVPICQNYLHMQFNRLHLKYSKSLLIPFLTSKLAKNNLTDPELFWRSVGYEFRPIDTGLRGDLSPELNLKTATLSLNPVVKSLTEASVLIEGRANTFDGNGNSTVLIFSAVNLANW